MRGEPGRRVYAIRLERRGVGAGEAPIRSRRGRTLAPQPRALEAEPEGQRRRHGEMHAQHAVPQPTVACTTITPATCRVRRCTRWRDARRDG
eukprot:4778239-Prymnesium_polylepis.1